MADINKIIDELLLELSVQYPFPNMKDREQVFALLEICDELGYGHLKPVLEEMFINEAEKEGESKLFPGKFHLGGGFYSGKSGGEAELKNDKGNLRAVTPDEKAKFDAKSGKSPSADKPTDTPKPNQPSSETPSAEQPKAAPDKAEAPAPMKQTPVVKTPADVLKSKVEKWSEKEKEFFKKGEDKPGSPTRRSFGEALKDKVKGARNAIAHGFKHEVHVFKEAGSAVKNLVSGKPLEKEQKKALISVGIKVASTALFAAAGGGLAHGAAYFAKHVAMELIPHAVAETIIVGVGRASLFAGADGDDERMLADFMDAVADNMENMEIPDELMMSMVDSYNEKKKPSEPQSEVIDLNELFNRILNEEDGKGESKEFPGKFHLGGGYYSSTDGGEAELKNDKGTLRPLTDKEKAELNNQTPSDEPTDGESDKDKPDTASMVDTATKALDSKEKEAEKTLPKDNPDLVLNDPKASAKSKAMAKAFKSQQTVELEKRKEDPNYEKELKADVNAKIESARETLKNRKSEDGDALDSETTENGSLIVGVEHGDDNESTQEIIKIIKSLPKDAKIMFVGEGGMSKDDNGELELAGEQAEIRDAVKGHFNNSDESSWDENANVYDDNSPVFDEIAKELGGSKSKSKASIWSNMVGQGDDLSAEDYLDEEGKIWLIDQAKKGGSSEFDGEVDWDNLSLEQKEDLYQLNFRDDTEYGETEISKGQKAYNDFRQKELDRKIKEAEDNGFTVIAPVGNSHVDMWRNRNKPTKSDFKPQSLRALQKELPEADKDVFNKQSDLDKIPSDKKEEISMKIDELASKASKGEDFNLCQITVPGTNLYCDDNQGIPREEMPQFKGKPLPGTPSEDLPKDKNGEVDTEPLFKKMLKEKGIKTVESELPSDKLKATQSELVGSKVAGMTKALEEDPNNPGITAPIYVSRDGFVIDGHHRWAAVTSAAIKAGKPANMKVIVVDMDIKDAIPMCNQFAEEQGIAAKKADAKDGELPAPKEPSKKEGGAIYPVGGNYYSDTPDGPAQYVKTESVVREIFENENEKFLSLLFEESVTKKLPDGDTVKVTPIDVKDQPEATEKADELDSNKEGEDSAQSDVNVTPLAGKDYKDVAAKQMNQPKYKDSILDDNLKEQISTIVGKITGGEDLTDEEQVIAKDYIKIVNDKKVKIYIASKKKGDWSQQGYIKVLELGAGKASKEWADGASKKYGVTTGKSGQGAVGKKDPTPAKIIGEEKEIEIGIIDENTVIFNGKTHKKLAVPTIEEAKAKLKQSNPNLSDEELEEKASLFVNKIKSKNDSIDELAEISKKTGGKFKTVDIGDTTTPEGRNKAREKILDKSVDKFTQLLGDKKDLPENQKVMETFEKLRDFDGEDVESNPEKQKEYQKLLDELQINMFNSKDFRDGIADFAEIKVGLELLSKGNSVYLPADEAFKTADVLVVNQISENETDIEFLLVSLEFSGGISVKMQGGAAGTSDEKWRQSRFKSNETRRRGNRMLSTYDLFYSEKQTPPDFPPSDEQVNEQKAGLEDDKKWMVENGIATEEELTAAEDWANRRVAAVLEKFKDNGVLDCMKDEEKVRFEETMKLYYKNQKISEVLYNNDLDYTNFKNSNQKFSISKGKAVSCQSENLDGVENPCYMKIKDDVGFNYSKQGDCTVVRPTNRNPSEIHKEKPKVK
jgi:hypothetical protein